MTIIGVICWYWYGDHKDLGFANLHIGRLQADSTQSVNKYLRLENKYLLTVREKADIVDASKDAGEEAKRKIDAAKQKLATTIANSNLEKKKMLADRNVGGVGVVETTVYQGGLNGQIASLKGQLEDSNSSNVDLSSKNAVLTQENTQLKVENRELKSQVSELENIENKVYVEAARDWQKEYDERRFLGSGRRKAAKANAQKYLSKVKVSQ